MKNLIYILCLLVCNFCCAQNAPMKDIALDIKHNFSSESISAYQQNSENKIKEFYEYLTVYSQQSTDAQLKHQIKENLETLFSGLNSQVLDFTSAKHEDISLKELLSKIENKNLVFSASDFKNGEVLFDHWFTVYSLKITGQKESGNINIEHLINFQSVEKKFGMETNRVWQVVLGEILIDN